MAVEGNIEVIPSYSGGFPAAILDSFTGSILHNIIDGKEHEVLFVLKSGEDWANATDKNSWYLNGTELGKIYGVSGVVTAAQFEQLVTDATPVTVRYDAANKSLHITHIGGVFQGHLIVYPTPNWNTFADLATLVGVMGQNFPDEALKFGTFTQEKQTALAINAGTWIKTCSNITYPSPLPSDFVLAQVAIMATSLDKSPLDYDVNERAITKEKVGELEVDYDPKYKGSSMDVHPFVYRLLSPYGCSGNTGFSQSNTRKA